MHKKVCHKGKLKFENYKNCLEGTQLENKINHLENKKCMKIVSFVTKEKITSS